MKKFFSDFKAFISKGNILDMAVGVVVGGAFSKIVSSLVADIINPLIGLATGDVALADMKYVFQPEVVDEVTKGFQCSRDYAVASMMVATSTMLGKRVSCGFGSYSNFPSLWIAIVGRTASGKTAPLSFFFKPIELMEREAFANYRMELQEWEQTDPNNSSNYAVKPLLSIQPLPLAAVML